MRTLIKSFEGYVDFFDYCVSHKQLLLRYSQSENEKHFNTDFLFDGVFYLQTVTTFGERFEIYEGDEDDKKYISSVVHSKIYWQFAKVYVVIEDETEYFIGAASLKIERNDLPVHQTSISIKKEWYKPTTFEEVKAHIEKDTKEFEDYMQKIKDIKG